MCHVLRFASWSYSPEPQGSLQECFGPLTSLHRIIPAITQGYAVCDIINGFHLLSKGLGPEFLAHGVGKYSMYSIWIEAFTNDAIND